MNNDIIKLLSKQLNIKINQIENTLQLLQEGCTVPFIARYRKERTGGLVEDEIRGINKEYEYQVNLLKRKEDVIRLIDEKGLLTKELKNTIMACNTLSLVEDQYRPYKEKKKTKATIAISKGFKPLADYIYSLPRNGNIEKEVLKYVTEDYDKEEVLQGAKDIIAEIISDDPKIRQHLKDVIFKVGIIKTNVKKNNPDEKQVYQMYYEYSERVKTIASHRILAINRAEKEKVITVHIEIDDQRSIQNIYNHIIRKKQTIVNDIILDCVKDAYKRLIYPSIEREIRNELTISASDKALGVFSINLEKLLLQAPLKDKYVLGLDPAFRTGCKLAAIDPTGKVLGISKVFITIPKDSYERDEKTLLSMIKKYGIEIIAIGNGTASRESESFIAKFIKKYKLNVQYVIVSEAGASVYSASSIAKEEFPDYAVEERSAVSIARRLQDPLSELVKIEPKAISVGQYQHDMNQKKLTEQLDYVVEKVVNQVGVNINTASPSLLKYVSGLTNKSANNIVKYREENGMFTSRDQVKNVPSLGPKSFEQSIGFLRILNGNNVLDETSIHPDDYEDAIRLLDYINSDINDIESEDIKNKINNLNKDKAMNDLNIDSYLLDDLCNAFISPHRTPRDEYNTPILKSDILKIEDLKEGMQLEGVVRNVVDFGAFVDIGLKNDGLVHISRMSNKRIKHPLDVVNVGDIITVYVHDIDIERKRVGLSMIH